MTKTIFEKIVDREIPASIVYEDENFLAFLDNKPTIPGHTLVIPKKPFKDLLEIPDDLITDYMSVIKKVANGIKIALKTDGFNLLMNNGEASGQEVFHAHLHIIPRFKDKKIDMNRKGHVEYSSGEEMEEYRDRITKSILKKI